MRTATRNFTPESAFEGFGRLENLLAMTSALVETANKEMMERYSHKDERVYLIPDEVVSDILWQISDNFIEMKAVRDWLAKESMKECKVDP